VARVIFMARLRKQEAEKGMQQRLPVNRLKIKN
jgi:hypothetical protein